LGLGVVTRLTLGLVPASDLERLDNIAEPEHQQIDRRLARWCVLPTG
jgi:hypothetical protein